MKIVKIPDKSEKLAELVGIILGDGHLHQKSNLITITGSLEDLEYYRTNVIKLFEYQFHQTPYLKRRNDRNSYYLMLCSKQVMNLFVNEIGLIRGCKVNARIPKIIFLNREMALAFLRGLFDTDGCLKFSKQSRTMHYYPRVQIALRKSPLASELEKVFTFTNFKYSKWRDTRVNEIIFYQVSGKINTERWFREVRPKNPVHITKFQFWKKFGYYVPKSSLTERKQKLLIS